MTRSYHHGDLRRAILSAARREIEADGLERFTVAAVARELGVSSAAPYHHFRNTEAVLEAIAEEVYAEWTELLWQPLRPLVSESAPDPDVVIAAQVLACRAFVEYCVDHPVLARLSLVDHRPPPESDAVAEARRWIAASQGLLVSAGVIDPGTEQQVTADLYCVMRGAIAVAAESPRLLPGSMDAGSLVEHMVRMVLATAGRLAVASLAQRSESP